MSQNIENTGHCVREFGGADTYKCPFLNLTLLIPVKALWFLHPALCFSLFCLPFLFPASFSCFSFCFCYPAEEANKLPSHVVFPPNPTFPTSPITNLSGSDFWNQPLKGIACNCDQKRKCGSFTLTEVLGYRYLNLSVSMTSFLLHYIFNCTNIPGKSVNQKLSEKTCLIQLSLHVIGFVDIINIIF